ncbi:MAG: hypothetical protein ACD_41C00384G0007 [uncultured bacterium]|nr:MAG: hypothetical protein ACD_41C00384G0007 [uncultured bacterium]
MSKVYVCTGSCGGQAMEPGVCQTDGCERNGQPLEPMMQCDQCGALYHEGDEHTCA